MAWIPVTKERVMQVLRELRGRREEAVQGLIESREKEHKEQEDVFYGKVAAFDEAIKSVLLLAAHGN